MLCVWYCVMRVWCCGVLNPMPLRPACGDIGIFQIAVPLLLLFVVYQHEV